MNTTWLSLLPGLAFGAGHTVASDNRLRLLGRTLEDLERNDRRERADSMEGGAVISRAMMRILQP